MVHCAYIVTAYFPLRSMPMAGHVAQAVQSMQQLPQPTPQGMRISLTGVYFAALHLFFVCAGLLCGCLLVWEEGCYCIHCQPGVARCHPRNCKESLMVVNSSSYVPPTGFMNSKHLPAPMKWGKAVDLICPLMWLRILLV